METLNYFCEELETEFLKAKALKPYSLHFNYFKHPNRGPYLTGWKDGIRGVCAATDTNSQTFLSDSIHTCYVTGFGTIPLRVLLDSYILDPYYHPNVVSIGNISAQVLPVLLGLSYNVMYVQSCYTGNDIEHLCQAALVNPRSGRLSVTFVVPDMSAAVGTLTKYGLRYLVVDKRIIKVFK